MDDTDGLEPDAEFEAWRLRELGRIKRDKEAELRKEEERAELERRRALPEAQRLAEDLAHAEKLRADHPDARMVSAGMSQDLEQAIAAGATHVRIGTDVLGPRPHVL